MASTYTPLTTLELDALAVLLGFQPPNWTGPGLPRGTGVAGLTEVFETFDHLLSRAQYLIQIKEALSIPYTLRGITAPAKRFMLGTDSDIESVAALREIVTLVEAFFRGLGLSTEEQTALQEQTERLKAKLDAAKQTSSNVEASSPSISPSNDEPDYSAFALEHTGQFSMSWTTFEDAFRAGYPLVPEYVARVEDPKVATESFWPTLAGTALPYNLLVLRRLQASSVEPFRNNFGSSWTNAFDEALTAGTLYGIDMTIFAGLAPQTMPNNTVRTTPSTMGLLIMDAAKKLAPVAVYVADSEDINSAQVYTPSSPAWVYSLLALKTSLTVHGIWLGHVYTLHIVTAALQMTMWNTFPKNHILHQAIAPQSNFTIPFDVLLLLGWSHLSPPTSISDPGKFLTLCARFAGRHDFFSTDPEEMLTSLNLDPVDFTDEGQPAWNRYPNVTLMLKVWQLTATYVHGVVNAAYATDADVLADTHLASWIATSSDPNGGNVIGLPRVNSKQALERVLTSLLYRINFHGIGRLRSMGTPCPSFAPNYPPCLQSQRVPSPANELSTGDLLSEFLPKTGTLGGLISFYDLFSFNAPYEPLVPDKGPKDALFFDPDKFASANDALVSFREGAAALVKELQPEWVQVGQWPMNIEL